MALIECPECARKVSTLAASCPGCGWPVPTASPEISGDPDPHAGSQEALPPTTIDYASSYGTADQFQQTPFVPAQAPPLSHPQHLAPAGIVPQRKPQQNRLFWMLAFVVLCFAGVGGYMRFIHVEHPTRESCVVAVNKLYDAVGWKWTYHHKRYSIEEGVDSCIKLSKEDVDCIAQRSDHPYLCSNASSILIEQPHNGLFCFARVDNKTSTKTWSQCALNEEECESKRSDAEGTAIGAKLEECQSFDKLYGVMSATQEEGKTHGWYGLTPDETECHLYWRKNAAELRNVEPGCREVLYGARPGNELPEPERPPIPSGQRPAAPWCIHSNNDNPDECQPTEQECEEKRRDMPYAILYSCRQQSQAAFFIVDNSSVRFYKDFVTCKARADTLWSNGTEATECEILH